MSLADIEETQKYADELHLKIPILTAPRSNPIPETHKIAGTPWYYALDEHGKVEAGGPAFGGNWENLLNKWRLDLSPKR